MSFPIPNVATLASLVADYAIKRTGWRLSPADDATQRGLSGLSDEDLTVEAQFPQEDVQWDRSVATTASAGVGDAEESTNPAEGRASGSLQAVFQAEHCFDDIRPIRSRLERMTEFVPSLNRRPLMLFSHQDKRELVWVTAVNCRIPRGSYDLSGLPKRYEVSITLSRARERRLDSTRQGEEPSTYYHVMREGETYEHLALWHLGDPRLGPLIRRDPANLAVEEGVAGDTVRILPKANSYMRQEMKPAAPFYATDHRTGESWEASFEALAQDRLGGT